MSKINFPRLPYGSVVYNPSKNSCFVAEYNSDQEEHRWMDDDGSANVLTDDDMFAKNRDGSLELLRDGRFPNVIKERAWDEGWSAGFHDVSDILATSNPYRPRS